MGKLRHASSKIYWMARGLFHSTFPSGSFFGIEGALYTLILIFAHNNNNLYATRLGATSMELGLLASLPPFVGFLTLIPASILTDRVPNKRPVVSGAVIFLSIIYLCMGLIGFMDGGQIPILLGLLALANLPMSLYNSSWQSFFSDTTIQEQRNDIFTFRTRMTMVVSMAFPLVVGSILTMSQGRTKITVHQIYYFMTLLFAAGIVVALKKIPASMGDKQPNITWKIFKGSVSSLFAEKTFRGFLVVAILIYMSWSMDWSIVFQSQFTYLGLSEVQMNIVATLSAITQFLALAIWSRLVKKKGPRFVLFIGAVGFVGGAIPMLLGLFIPGNIGKTLYLCLQCFGACAFSAFNLSVLQCLLEALPKEGRKSIHIAMYNTMLLASNIVMPFLGVFIYNRLGESRTSMQIAYSLVFVLRIVASFAAWKRWKNGKKQFEADLKKATA